MLNFLVDYGCVALELGRLLAMRFGYPYTSAGSRSQIGKVLVDVLQYDNQDRHDSRDLELIKLKFLVKQLKTIEEYDINLLKAFRRQMHRSHSWSSYFGLRMEINIASALINKNVKFTKGESPDFTIHKERDVYLECGSIHLTRSKEDFLRKKLSSVISNKSNKSYCNPATALCVDITNIFFHSAVKGDFFTKDTIKGHTKDALINTESELGSVLLFAYMLNQNLNKYESTYLRVDNENVDGELMKFINDFYPLGRHTVDITAIPKQG